MASVMLRSTSLLTKNSGAAWLVSNISTSSSKLSDDIKVKAAQKEAPLLKHDLALINPGEVEHRRRLQGYITVTTPEVISPISGIPEEHIKERRVRIYQPPRNCMQSGTDNINVWEIDFDTRERWENPLMGWTSTGDPHSNLKVQFNNKDEAIVYCEKNGWKWFLQEKTTKQMKPKSYGVNFSWNKRTRASTK
ncbi:NADH dehydrogenase ubiquinone Fe-S protein 4 [Popillia japonica]|uniref:NADH dehydrogenase [ubiquinone] iron-sulfur protein 4, mitochondrial n=1 Tax=Popillia japonica TaxID=7064 RepID=A0AAW1IVW1_POPJA